MKRFLSVLLALVMMFSMVITTVIHTGAAESASTVEVVFELTGVRGVQGTFDYSGDADVQVLGFTGPKNSTVSATEGKYWFVSEYDTTATFTLTLAISGEVGEKATVVFDYLSYSDAGEDVETTYEVVLEVVDYTELEKAINNARFYVADADRYVTMDAVNAALAYAESLLKASYSQAEVDAAAAALNDAVAALELYFPVDYSDLKAAIADAESRHPYSYTVESYERMAKALAAAKAILNQADTQAQVDKVCAELRNAITRLVPESTDVDYARLTAAVEAAEALDVEIYTPETWANLVAALTPAKEMLDGQTALSQRHADDVAAALEAAIEALEKTPLDLTTLYQLIADAEALDSYRYTSDSWTVLENALNAAKNLDPKKQAEVDAAANDLAAALAGLEELPPVDYTALNAALGEAKAATKGEFTDKSWNALQAAIIAAEALLPDRALVQSQVDTATEALNAALAGLTVPEITVETEIVTEVVTEIVTVEPTDDFCNIDSHGPATVWIVLFVIFLVLFVAVTAYVGVTHIMKRKKESDNTPMPDYDMGDDDSETPAE